MISRGLASTERALAVGMLATCMYASAIEAQATRVSVSGRVIASGGTPVAGAIVELLRQRDSVRTSDSGVFVFPSVAPGDERLSVRAIGYSPKQVDMRVTSDSGWVGVILLDRIAQALPEVTVKGSPPEFANTDKFDDYFRRRRVGFGTFRSREDILKMGAFDMPAVLKGIPGVTVTGSANMYGEPEIRFRMARCPGMPPNMSVYLNGNRIAHYGNRGSELSGLTSRRSGTATTSTCEACASLQNLLASIPFTDIQFVEFYRGPGQIPAEYDLGDACAVLGIWTR